MFALCAGFVAGEEARRRATVYTTLSLEDAGNRPASLWMLKILGAQLQADGGNEVRAYGLKH